MKAQASRASKYNCELASLCGVVAEESTDPTLVFLKIDGRRKPSGVKDNVDVSGVSGVTDSNPLCNVYPALTRNPPHRDKIQTSVFISLLHGLI
jgi:hypothetical protein